MNDTAHLADTSEHIEQRPLALDVAERLEAEIIRGRLAPGEKLREIELSQRYGISRSPLREAFQLVEAAGLVTRRPRYGVRVAEMSLRNLDELTTCRAPLEATAAALIAARPDHVRVADQLDRILARMRRAAEAGDLEAIFRTNVALTDKLHEACNNTVLARLLEQLNKPALRYRYHGFRDRPDTLPATILGNERMIAAIRSGDAAQAEAATRTLVLEAWQERRRMLID